MPYGLCVASGAVAGFIGMVMLVFTETPRSTPMQIDSIPLGSSVSAADSVVLEHSANLMFDNARPGSAPLPIPQDEMLLPIGQRVVVQCVAGVASYTGRLISADSDWVELDQPERQRVWVARQQILTITEVETLPASAQ